MKKVKIICAFMATLVLLTGCGNNDKVNKNSKLVAAKNNMEQNLKNYSMDVEITSKTGFIDLSTEMECELDFVHNISHCASYTAGVEVEEYYDNNNNVTYTKTSGFFGTGSDWEKTKTISSTPNTWLNLNDYIFDLKEESKYDGTLYTGVIDSKKLAAAMSGANSNVNVKDVVSDKIDIKVYVNSSNYIENLEFSMTILGVKQNVKVRFRRFNTTGDVVIPERIK